MFLFNSYLNYWNVSNFYGCKMSRKFTATLTMVCALFFERMKIQKVEKRVTNLHDKMNICYSHQKIKASFKSWIMLKKVHRIIKFNQKSWPKTYIDMNTELNKKTKNDFEKDFFRWMNNLVFENTQTYVRKHRDI